MFFRRFKSASAASSAVPLSAVSYTHLIQSTVDTQLHIYEEIIRRHNRPKRDRDGVVICGAYGRGNAGDDAILEAILQEMRSIDPDMPITVLTKDPKATRLTYRVRTAGRMEMCIRDRLDALIPK